MTSPPIALAGVFTVHVTLTIHPTGANAPLGNDRTYAFRLPSRPHDDLSDAYLSADTGPHIAPSSTVQATLRPVYPEFWTDLTAGDTLTLDQTSPTGGVHATATVLSIEPARTP